MSLQCHSCTQTLDRGKKEGKTKQNKNESEKKRRDKSGVIGLHATEVEKYKQTTYPPAPPPQKKIFINKIGKNMGKKKPKKQKKTKQTKNLKK